VFFSILLLINFAYAEALNLGPHLRVDIKSFEDLKIPQNKIVLLITPQCSYCKIQLKDLDCLDKNDVYILLDKSDERDLPKLKIPSGLAIFLTTRKSLVQFNNDPVYPMGFVRTANGIKHFKGLKECKVLKGMMHSKMAQFKT